MKTYNIYTNKYDEIIKERLENRREWATYYRWLLTHRELHQKAKKAYFKATSDFRKEYPIEEQDDIESVAQYSPLGVFVSYLTFIISQLGMT